MALKVIPTLSFKPAAIYDTYRNELYDTRLLRQVAAVEKRHDHQRPQWNEQAEEEEYPHEDIVNDASQHEQHQQPVLQQQNNTAPTLQTLVDEHELKELEMMDLDDTPLWFMSHRVPLATREAEEGEEEAKGDRRELMDIVNEQHLTTSELLPTTTQDIDTIVEAVLEATEEAERRETEVVKARMQAQIERREEKKQQRQQVLSRQDLFSKECELLETVQRLTESAARFDHTAEEIIETGLTKTDFLSAEEDLKEEPLTEMMRLLKHNTLMELAYRDKRSKKILELEDRLEETYLFEYQERGDRGVERLNNIVGSSYRITQDPEHDEAMIINSKPKKRGRTRDDERRQKPNAIELHRKEWATCKKTNLSTATTSSSTEKRNIFSLDLRSGGGSDEDDVARTAAVTSGDEESSGAGESEKSRLEQSDKYKTFIMVLKLLHDNIQSETNHGYYLAGIRKLVAQMAERPEYDWPMLSLCQAILRMQMCLGIETLERIQLTPDEEYYCSYTGQRICSGDTVKHIRILVKDHYRHNRWEILKSLPDRRFESPEFTDSVKAFFIKSPIVSPPGLFYRDFSDRYKAIHPAYFGLIPQQQQQRHEEERPVKRVKHQQRQHEQTMDRGLIIQTSDNLLWVQLNVLRDTLSETETACINYILDGVTDSSSTFTQALASIIDIYWEDGPEDDDDDETASARRTAFTNQHIYLLLDMLDVLFVYSAEERALEERDLTADELAGHIRSSGVSMRENNAALLHLLNLARHVRRSVPQDSRVNPFLTHSENITHCEEFTAQSNLFLCVFNYLFPPAMKNL
jgi:hypothetical protein